MKIILIVKKVDVVDAHNVRGGIGTRQSSNINTIQIKAKYVIECRVGGILVIFFRSKGIPEGDCRSRGGCASELELQHTCVQYSVILAIGFIDAALQIGISPRVVFITSHHAHTTIRIPLLLAVEILRVPAR